MIPSSGRKEVRLSSQPGASPDDNEIQTIPYLQLLSAHSEQCIITILRCYYIRDGRKRELQPLLDGHCGKVFSMGHSVMLRIFYESSRSHSLLDLIDTITSTGNRPRLTRKQLERGTPMRRSEYCGTFPPRVTHRRT